MSWTVSCPKVEKVLNPPQKPVTIKGCNQFSQAPFCMKKTVVIANIKQAKTLEINVAKGNVWVKK